MAVKKEPNGRRSVEVQCEVPGTPEQVWDAIATGHGITAWFVPTDMEIGDDGTPKKHICHFGPGMDSASDVTKWEPPHRYVAEGSWGPGMPTIATEWIVEAKAGGKCIVRVVHSLFASTDDWDNQIAGTETGWPHFFRILRLYLTHFRGQRCSPIQLMAMTTGTHDEAWTKLAGAIGLGSAKVGDRWQAPKGMPPLAGKIEHIGKSKDVQDVILRADTPSQGIVSMGAFVCGGPIQVTANLYLYGDQAPAAVKANEANWQKWINEVFPPAPNPSE